MVPIEIEILKGDTWHPLTAEGILFCNDVYRGSPEINTDYIDHYSSDGSEEGNSVFKPFDLVAEFTLFYEFDDDYYIYEQDYLFNKVYQRQSYYVRTNRMKGKMFKVKPKPVTRGSKSNSQSTYTITWEVFEGCSESVISTTDERFVYDDTWQVGQGINLEDYKYTHKRSNFIIYNNGDFTIDPRQHGLVIKIEGRCDDSFSIFNKTTLERFIYNGPVSKAKGDVIELNGIHTYKNGVIKSVDTNGALVSLAPGKNIIEISNLSDVKISFDFRFRYK